MLKLSFERYNKIDSLVKKWHYDDTIEMSLSKFLDFSKDEYADFVSGNFEIEYDHDYQIEIKFEDATIRKKNYDQNTGVTTIFPSFPSICKLSIRSKENYIFNFESIGFNFGCLGFLTKPDIINWFENAQNIDFFKNSHEVDYNKFIKFKLASMEYSIYE
jgi:hypothetical protein